MNQKWKRGHYYWSHRNQKGYNGIQCILLYANKLGNLDEMEKFPERYKLPKQTQEVENLNGPVTNKGIELVI